MTDHDHPIPTVDAQQFPELREFLRGYLHQDLLDEYGSPEKAARQFCADAGASQRSLVAAQWQSFLAIMKDQPLAVINHQLTANLGSSHNFSSLHELGKLSVIFRDHYRQQHSRDSKT